MTSRPTIYIVAGPNGAGKSTLYETRIAPSIRAPFINADLIQKDELRDPALKAAYQAARIASERRAQCLLERRSFVTESTFSHPSKLELVDEARAAGFRVMVLHVGVRSAELSVLRVAARVRHGGHDVPADKIRERYARNQALIRRAVEQADDATVYDNSVVARAPRPVLQFRHGKVVRRAERLPDWVVAMYGLTA